MYDTEITHTEMTGIDIVLPAGDITVGNDIPARCVILHSDGRRTLADEKTVSWKCSNTSVCDIVDGVLRACGRGSADIQAQFESFIAAKAITVTAPLNYSKILISEVYYDPLTLADAEFIELWNTSDEDIDLGGCSVTEGSFIYSYTFPLQTIIPAGGKIVLPRNTESFYQEFSYYPEYPSSNITLGNSGETVLLLNPKRDIIDIVFIEGGDTKYPQPEGWCESNLPNASKGYSTSRISPENSNTCMDWMANQPNPEK